MLYAFAAAIGILLMIFKMQGLLPFGDNTMIVWDMQYQYSAFMSWYMEVLHGNTPFLYSLRGGLGGSTIGLFAYYLASPLNLLLFFFNLETLPQGITLILILKTGISALAMQRYLYSRKGSAFTVIFACLYALSSYAVCFQYNIMWMDAYMLLPFVILFLDNLLKGKRGLGYSIVLGICIAANYYIGFMVCLFCVLYFAAVFLTTKLSLKGGIKYEWKSQCKLLKSFGGYSLLAGMLAAVVILPGGLTLRNSSSGRVVSPAELFDFTKMFKPIAGLKYMLPYTFDEHQGILGRYPMIYAGSITILLVIVFFLSREIALASKIKAAIILAVLYVGMLFKGPFIIWHGFCMPSGCYERAAFLWVFMTIVVAYEAWTVIENKLLEIPKSAKLRSIVVCAVFALFGIAIAGELVLNGIKIHRTQYEELYASYDSYADGVINLSKLEKNMDDASVYRAVIFSGYGDSANKGYLYRMNGINQYSSAESENTWQIYGALGLGAPGRESEVEFDAQADALAADILGVRYIYEELDWDVYGYEQVSTEGNVGLYINEDALPLGFLVRSSAADIPIYDDNEEMDLFDRQNDIYRSIYGANVSASPYTPEYNDENILSDKQEYELRKVPQIFKLEDRMYTDGYQVVSENTEMIRQAVIECAKYTDSITENEGTVLSGEFSVPEADEQLYICFSVPYDDNISVKVDGVDARSVSGMGGLLLVPVSKGEHTIDLYFHTPGLAAGSILTLIGIAVLTLTLFDDKIKRICFRR